MAPRRNRKLTWPLYTRDGVAIKTLADARDYALALPDSYSQRVHWQRAAEFFVA
jgi:hypothetical protein